MIQVVEHRSRLPTGHERRLVDRHLQIINQDAGRRRAPGQHDLQAARPVHRPPLGGAGLQRRDLRRHRLPNTWDESRAQGGRSGILVNYTGGSVGAGFGSGSPTSRAKQLLAQLEPLLPGITAKWNGRATVDFWLGNPWSKGSYSFWKVGQYTRFAGVEREPEGNVTRRRAHLGQLPGLPQRRSRDRPASRPGTALGLTSVPRCRVLPRDVATVAAVMCIGRPMPQPAYRPPCEARTVR